MAEETLDKAIEVCGLKPKRCCQTLGLMLDGAHNWSPTMHIKLVQNFGLDVKVVDLHSCIVLVYWTASKPVTAIRKSCCQTVSHLDNMKFLLSKSDV